MNDRKRSYFLSVQNEWTNYPLSLSPPFLLDLYITRHKVDCSFFYRNQEQKKDKKKEKNKKKVTSLA